MRYKSTRGNSSKVGFSEVLLGGLAPDGGLYMPKEFPKFTLEEIHSWSELSFQEIASKVLYPYVDEEIEEHVFNELVEEAYSCLLYTSPSPRDKRQSRMPSSA